MTHTRPAAKGKVCEDIRTKLEPVVVVSVSKTRTLIASHILSYHVNAYIKVIIISDQLCIQIRGIDCNIRGIKYNSKDVPVALVQRLLYRED